MVTHKKLTGKKETSKNMHLRHNLLCQICDATCQNQALLANIGFLVRVIVLFNNFVSLAFIPCL